MDEFTSTNRALHFYRYDDPDTLKLGRFIEAVNRDTRFPSLRQEEVLFYFDETFLGKGDRGVAITREAVFCLLGKWNGNFQVEFANMKALSISGSLIKKIKIISGTGEKQNFTLMHSPQGARRVFYVMNTLIP